MIYEPDNYGAVGNGIADDTAAIQACLNAAGIGGCVQFRGGATYRIDTNYQPAFPPHQVGGIKPLAEQTVLLNGCTLKALPTASGEGSVVTVYGVDGVQLIGPGNIVGERDIHQGSGDEHVHGISFWTANGWYMAPGIAVSNCWGDGVLIGHADQQTGTYCTDWLIDGVRIDNVRRNGISVTAGRRGTIRSAHITNVDGTPPFGAIDLEPDEAQHPNQDIVIDGLYSRNTSVGVYATVGNERVLVTHCDVEAIGSGIRVGDNAKAISIIDNLHLSSVSTGPEGACVDFTANNPTSIDGVIIEGNRLVGGYGFAVDVVAGYKNLTVRNNVIVANNPGQLGFARMLGGGEFTANNCTVTAAAGAAGQQFVQLTGCQYGRNVFRNESGKAMFAILTGGTDLGNDAYLGPNLSRPSGRQGRTMQVLYTLRQPVVGGSGIAPGSTIALPISGVDCVNNSVLVTVSGGGENISSDAFKAAYAISSRTTNGCTVTLLNNGASGQSLNADIAVVAGA